MLHLAHTWLKLSNESSRSLALFNGCKRNTRRLLSSYISPSYHSSSFLACYCFRFCPALFYSLLLYRLYISLTDIQLSLTRTKAQPTDSPHTLHTCFSPSFLSSSVLAQCSLQDCRIATRKRCLPTYAAISARPAAVAYANALFLAALSRAL